LVCFRDVDDCSTPFRARGEEQVARQPFAQAPWLTDYVFEEGYGYYLKMHAEDLVDPVVSLFRSWLIGRFRSRAWGKPADAEPVG